MAGKSHAPPASPIVSKRDLTPDEAQTYKLYVRKSLVVGPDGQPIRRQSVAESRRRSISSQPPIEIPISPLPDEKITPARRSVAMYSDARPRSDSPEV